MDAQQLRKYAELAVRVGANVQPGQNLIIGYGIRQVLPEHVEFVRHLVAAGYDAGAKFVQVDWGDEWWQRETVQRGSLETLAARARAQAAWVMQLAEDGAASIGIPSEDPKLYEGIHPERVSTAVRSIRSAIRPFTDKRTNDDYSWTLVAAPTQAWADQVFPDLPQAERMEALWRAILACARADGADPVASWEVHLQNLIRRRDWLNQLDIRQLHYRGPGTDLTIDLHPNHYFKAAESTTPQGVRFIANIPTEEVYTVPLKRGVNGVVRSTMPLHESGSHIEGIELRFVDGRIVEYRAQTGHDALAGVIETDEGSHFLGEVALVPVDSPIAQRGILFHNTLFDENASCHLAIGKAYPLLKGREHLNDDEWEANGLNTSLMHVDFMIGSNELDIDARTASGQTIPIFRKGLWTHSV